MLETKGENFGIFMVPRLKSSQHIREQLSGNCRLWQIRPCHALVAEREQMLKFR